MFVYKGVYILPGFVSLADYSHLHIIPNPLINGSFCLAFVEFSFPIAHDQDLASLKNLMFRRRHFQ